MTRMFGFWTFQAEMQSTLPWPARALSWAMAEKSAVNEVAVTATVVAVLPLPPLPVVLVDEELLHATSATAAPRVVNTDTACRGVTLMCLLLFGNTTTG